MMNQEWWFKKYVWVKVETTSRDQSYLVLGYVQDKKKMFRKRKNWGMFYGFSLTLQLMMMCPTRDKFNPLGDYVLFL